MEDKLFTAFSVALGEYGIQEWTQGHNPEVLKYFHEIGFTGVNDDETAWCAAYVNWCLWKAGLPHTGALTARSFLDWGKSIYEPKVPCIAVLSRRGSSWMGHVGFWIKSSGSEIWLLGGNQNNQVSIGKYPGYELLGLRTWKQ